jgi:4-amino-4-deoxy-L-arabinose transferase-like glycosyltransferase
MRRSSFAFFASRWWIGLLAVVVLATVFRFVGYDFSLPYVDHPDEPVFYLTGQEWRGLFDIQGYLTGYPPLYIWLNIVVQVVLEAIGVTSMAATVGILRLISGVLSLLTTVLIALTARLAFPKGSWAGEAAGLFGAAAWAVSPLVVENAIYATPDPLLYFLVILALYLAAASLTQPERPMLAFWSVTVGGLAILNKYFTLSAVLPGLLVLLMIWRTDRKRGSRLLLLSIGVLIIVGVVAAAGILVLPREGAAARSSGLTGVLDASRVLNNIYHAILPLDPIIFFQTLLLGAASFLAARKRSLPHVNLWVLALCALVLVSIPWLASTFSTVSATERMKDVLPATTAACVLLGAAVGQVILTLVESSAPQPTSRRTSGLLVAVVPLVFGALVFVPQINDSIPILQNRLLPDARVALRLWAGQNLEPGTVLVTQENHKTFNPFWGGIVGRGWFDWWLSDDWAAQTPAEWRAAHQISYAVIDQNSWQNMTASTRQAWHDQVLPLRTFDAPSRSSALVVLRLWGVGQALDWQFGNGIRLVGADLPPEEASAGDSLSFRFYWRADSQPTEDYSLFLHFSTRDDIVPLTQADGAPAFVERPTYTWNDPSETLIGAPIQLALAPDLAPGRYRVRLGLYNYGTLARLPITDAAGVDQGDAVDLMSITIR